MNIDVPLKAGLFPGVTFYLCMWYPRTAQAQRMGIFLSAATAAGAFGGLLAFGIEKMEGQVISLTARIIPSHARL